MKSGQLFLLLCFLVQATFLQMGCGNNPADIDGAAFYEYQVPEQLDDGWETAHLSEFGIDALVITEVVKQILDGTYYQYPLDSACQEWQARLRGVFSGTDRL